MHRATLSILTPYIAIALCLPTCTRAILSPMKSSSMLPRENRTLSMLAVDSAPAKQCTGEQEEAVAQLDARALMSIGATAYSGAVISQFESWFWRLPQSFTLPAALLFGFAFFVLAAAISPLIPRKLWPYMISVGYVAISVIIDVSIASQKTSQQGEQTFNFHPAAPVVVTEVVKLFFSVMLWSASQIGAAKFSWPAELRLNDIAWLTIPALCYAANNILLFLAIGKTDVSQFGVFRDTLVIWTAMVWTSCFQVKLGRVRIAAIATIFAGLILNELFVGHTSTAFSFAFVWVLALTLCNAFAAVTNEFALKRNQGLDINVQNGILYMMCAMFAISYMYVSDRSRLASPAAFFEGFTSITLCTIGLQSMAGLLVSRLLKYVDAVTKTIATCFRGPVLLFVSPFFLPTNVNPGAMLSAVIVAGACFVYLSQGPLETPEQSEKTPGDAGAKCGKMLTDDECSGKVAKHAG
eukprot:gnl/TRDRNA2_/TRDRNA2_179768_c0_seq1.p1 gnl/TRDRNA2_/TRDRNA2_179768_c0~~gnl/TRDRNA2_/TRDRNA2_179768_c0_seq1.p1  ORF type:complete len:467 (-),score=60.47 gnl/TRDRNA2_/TRDRNA2_179768_c0_seq1:151-1551(-)